MTCTPGSLSRITQINQQVDLFIGDQSAARNLDLLRRHNIRYILSLVSSEWLPYIETVSVPIPDIPEFPIQTIFPTTNLLLDQWIARADGNILIHCRAGISRSATILLAFLITHSKEGIDVWLPRVRTRRNCINPNIGFYRALQELSIARAR